MSDNPTSGEPLDIVDAVAKYGIKKLEPTTAGEWTVTEDGRVNTGQHTYEAKHAHCIVTAHNASLKPHKPATDEWSRQFVQDLCTLTISNYDAEEIADAHNAALAAERDDRISWQELYEKTNDQLTAERLKANQKEGAFMVASDANQKLREQIAAKDEFAASWKLTVESVHQRELAAEREKNDDWRQTYLRVAKERDEAERLAESLEGALHHPDSPTHTCLFKKQLAAERELVADAAAQILAKQLQLDAAVERIKVLEQLCAESLARIGGKPDDVEIYYDHREAGE